MIGYTIRDTFILLQMKFTSGAKTHFVYESSRVITMIACQEDLNLNHQILSGDDHQKSSLDCNDLS